MIPGLRISFTVTLVIAFAMVFTLGMSAVVVVFRQTGQAAAVDTAEQQLAQAAQLVAARGRILLEPVLVAAALLPTLHPLAAPMDDEAASRGDVAALLSLLAQEPAIQGVAVGFADGASRQVLRVSALAPRVIVPPAAAHFALFESDAPADGAVREAAWTFLDAAGMRLSSRRTAATTADPRSTPWYLQTQALGRVHVSPLYDLPLFGRPGLSVSTRLSNDAGVLSFDITLDGLSGFLAAQRVSPNATLFLMDADGLLLAHQDPARAVKRLADGSVTWLSLSGAEAPLLRAFWTAYAQGQIRPGVDARLVLDAMPMLVRAEPVADVAGAQLLAVVVAPVDDFTGPVLAGVQRGTLLALLALAVGLGGITLLATRVARPLERLTREAEAIRGFELDMPLRLDSRITEVQRLGGAMAAMKAALANFGAYVPRDLVRQLVSTGEAAVLGGDRRPLTVMFTDVEGFTSLAERLEPEEVMLITSAYFEALTKRLIADGATIDKYIGDAVMALWNAPRREDDHAARACLAALRTRQVSLGLECDFVARGWPALRTRLGVHTGEAVVGNVGSSDRLSYTAIGTMVNLASRLEGLNKAYGTSILVSDATRRDAGAGFVCRAVDLVLPKGAHTPIEIFELLGLAEATAEPALAPPPAALAGLDGWASVIAGFRAGRFAEALATLRGLPGAASDPLYATYDARLAVLVADPPAADWTPVVTYHIK